jgi:hypothetical protein
VLPVALIPRDSVNDRFDAPFPSVKELWNYRGSSRTVILIQHRLLIRPCIVKNALFLREKLPIIAKCTIVNGSDNLLTEPHLALARS